MKKKEKAMNDKEAKDEKIAALKKELLESQARERRLREALGKQHTWIQETLIPDGRLPKEAITEPAPPVAEVLEKVENCLKEFAWHHASCDFKNHPNMQEFCQCGYRKHFNEALVALQSLRRER